MDLAAWRPRKLLKHSSDHSASRAGSAEARARRHLLGLALLNSPGTVSPAILDWCSLSGVARPPSTSATWAEAEEMKAEQT